ncbi:Cytochrome P450 307a1, partial [Folsomia candida]
IPVEEEIFDLTKVLVESLANRLNSIINPSTPTVNCFTWAELHQKLALLQSAFGDKCRVKLTNLHLEFIFKKYVGPTQWPIFGNLFQFRKSPLKSMTTWGEQYGKIVGLRLGDFRAVQLNDYDHIKTAFSNPAFNGHPEFKPLHYLMGGQDHGKDAYICCQVVK